MRKSTESIPVRVLFSPTSRTKRSESSWAAAATNQNAALEMSPGTVKSLDSGTWSPYNEMANPLSELLSLRLNEKIRHHPLGMISSRERFHYRGFACVP